MFEVRAMDRLKAALLGLLASAIVASPVLAGSEIKVDLLRNGIGVMPSPTDFQFGQTGAGPDGKWAVVRDADARQGAALEQYSTDPYEGRMPLAIYQGASFRNVVATVRFKLLESTTRSAGIAVRVFTAGDYYVAVANALEGRVDLFHFIDGRRTRIAGAEAPVLKRRWQTLELAANESRFTVWLDGTPLFDAYDGALLKEGQVALWTEEDNVTRFDDLTIVPLGHHEGE
jgi:hypothetical protein